MNNPFQYPEGNLNNPNTISSLIHPANNPSSAPQMPESNVRNVIKRQPDGLNEGVLGSQSNKRARLRVSRACDRCRAQKIKCSGTKPCETCVKQSRNCVYNGAQHTVNHSISSNYNPTVTESPISGGNGLGLGMNSPVFANDVSENGSNGTNTSPEYVKFLEQRVKYLEGVINSSSHDIIPQASTSDPRFQLQEDECYQFSLSKWRMQRRAHNVLIQDLSKSVYNSLTSDSKKEVIIPRVQYFGWNMSGSHYLKPSKLPEFIDLMPDRALSRKLLDYFFEHINPLYVIIFQPVMMKQVETYELANFQKLDDSRANQTRLFSAKLYLVYALAMRFLEFSSDEKFPPGLEENLFKNGYQVVQILAFEWESVELIQCWLLITLYLRVTHRQTSSYHALGQAVTMTKSMSLNYQQAAIHNNTKPLERLKAKRIFWAVYTLDRLYGLQSGKHYMISDSDHTWEIPSMDFQKEDDGWLTLPALALIHLASITSHVLVFRSESLQLEKVMEVNRFLSKWNTWIKDSGFHDTDLFNDENGSSKYSPMVISQVKMNYYDLVIVLNMRILFNLVGKRVNSFGLSVESLLEASEGIIEILNQYDANKVLLTPWYSTLLLLFNVGLISITLINSGLYLGQSNYLLSSAVNLISKIRSPVQTSMKGDVVYQDKVTMAKECLWALKMLNHMVSLRLKESISQLKSIGIDHGPSDVNRNRFLQFGVKGKPPSTEEDLNTKKTTIYNNIIQTPIITSSESTNNVSPNNFAEENKDLFKEFSNMFSNDFTPEEDNLFGNLQWFDQWVDINK